MMMDLEQQLLNQYQQRFPLNPTPYQVIAKDLQTDTHTVLQLLSRLSAEGKVSRVGPVFPPNVIGASTLAAMHVPEAELEEVAMWINHFQEINHNYEREHRFNLWFVVVAPHRTRLGQVIDRIRIETGYAVMSLPLIREYHIDLGFRLDREPVKASTPGTPVVPSLPMDEAVDRKLIAAIQHGLPLSERPYREIGKRLGFSERVVIEKIHQLQSAGVIRRLGIVVRHHELGYHANAMVVWNVPDHQVDELGLQISNEPAVTLCYQRPRVLPDWPYNLFTMIHARERDEAHACLDRIIEQYELNTLPHETLFSRRRFKQCGAKVVA